MVKPNVRLWDMQKQQMVYDFHLTSNGEWLDSLEHAETNNQFTYKLLKNTELKDKEGNFIYEGDIARVTSTYKGLKGNEKPKSYTGVVIYEAPRFCVEGFYFSHYDDPCDGFERMDQVTVIGNQYEHAHLLKKESTT